jgi:hypothetical protein
MAIFYSYVKLPEGNNPKPTNLLYWTIPIDSSTEFGLMNGLNLLITTIRMRLTIPGTNNSTQNSMNSFQTHLVPLKHWRTWRYNYQPSRVWGLKFRPRPVWCTQVNLLDYLVGDLEHLDYFSIYWEFHHPNWRTHIFQRGRYTTNQLFIQNLVGKLCLSHGEERHELRFDGVFHQVLKRARRDKKA